MGNIVNLQKDKEYTKDKAKEIVYKIADGKNGIMPGKIQLKSLPILGSPTQPRARLVIVMAIWMDDK